MYRNKIKKLIPIVIRVQNYTNNIEHTPHVCLINVKYVLRVNICQDYSKTTRNRNTSTRLSVPLFLSIPDKKTEKYLGITGNLAIFADVAT